MLKVSVVIPVYNVAPYLRQCLDSVVGQTLHDIEIICVNDGSTDGSAAILAEYAAKDPRVKVLTCEHTNAGTARNAGMAAATGECLGFVDSDDWIHSDLFRRAYELLQTQDADAVEWGLRMYDDKLGRFGESKICPENQLYDKSYVFAPVVWGPCGRIVRRDLLLREGIKFQEVPYADDVYICCMIRALSRKTVTIPEALYYYRVNSGGSQQQSNFEHTHQIIAAWKAVGSALKDRGMLSSLSIPFVRSAANSMLHSLNTITKSAAYAGFYTQLRELYLHDAVFSSVSTADLVNDDAVAALEKIREFSEPFDFLVWQKGYLSEQKSRLWWRLQSNPAQKTSSSGNCRADHGRSLFSSSRLKPLRGFVKQFLPYGYMRRHLASAYHMDAPARGKTAVQRLFWDMMPFCFARNSGLTDGSPHGGERQASGRKPFSRQSLSAAAAMVPAGDFDAVFRDLAKASAQAKSAARYDCLPGLLERIAAASVKFDGEASLGRLSALLNYLRLKWTIELLDLPNNDATYLRLVEVANHIPAPEDFDALAGSADKAYATPASASPVVSFIVPAYNAERFVLRCLESLRRQTIPEVEIVCIDDGSTDDTPAILDEVAEHDRRVRVFHVANAGVAAARNLGLKNATGKYVVFVDADDYVDVSLAESASQACESGNLDICFFDFDCFDSKTRATVQQFWTMSNHRQDWIFGRVFSPRELLKWMHYGSSCTQMYSRGFLLENGAEFRKLALSEDAIFVYGLLPHVSRAMCLDSAMYHYRKGNSGSAVSRLSGSARSRRAVEAKLAGLQEFENLFETEFRGLDVSVRAALACRVAADIAYHSKASADVAAWIQSGHCQELLRLAEWWNGLPQNAAREVKKLESARADSVHDTYLVMGQVASPNIDPVDSWVFFRWLQDHGVPSRYLVWKESSFYSKLAADGALRDVVALNANGRDFELFGHTELMARVKAVVCEWQFDGPVDEWLRSTADLPFVFLQHGVTGWWLTEEHRQTFTRFFNWCNVFSSREQRLIEGDCPRGGHDTRFFVAGLPRYDLLSRRPDPGTKREWTVFVMFTWRRSLNAGRERLEMSAYWQGIKRLLDRRTTDELRRRGIRIVIAPHHRLQRFIPDLDFGEDVTVAGQGEIAEWIRKADAMVTDFSSASFDFMYQHKPTVFWIPDKDDLLLDRGNGQDGGKVDSALSLQKNFYNVAESFEDVVSMLNKYADAGFALEPGKCAIADTYFECSGCISERVYAQVENICSEGSPL